MVQNGEVGGVEAPLPEDFQRALAMLWGGRSREEQRIDGGRQELLLFRSWVLGWCGTVLYRSGDGKGRQSKGRVSLLSSHSLSRQ